MYSNTLSTVFFGLTHVAVFISSQDLSSKHLKVAPGKAKKNYLAISCVEGGMLSTRFPGGLVKWLVLVDVVKMHL